MAYELLVKSTGQKLRFKKRTNLQKHLLPAKYKSQFDYRFSIQKLNKFEDLKIKVEQFKMED